MLILGLLGMYVDAAVVFVTGQTLLFRLALAILCRFSLSSLEQFAEISTHGEHKKAFSFHVQHQFVQLKDSFDQTWMGTSSTQK